MEALGVADLPALVEWFVIRWQRAAFRIDRDDLRQTVWVGVLEAAAVYDPARGEFSTIAKPYIRYRVCELIRTERLRGVVVPDRGTDTAAGVAFARLRDMARAEPGDGGESARSAWAGVCAVLTDRERRTLELWVVEARPLSEIATALGVSKTMAHKIKARAAAKARTAFGESPCDASRPSLSCSRCR